MESVIHTVTSLMPINWHWLINAKCFTLFILITRAWLCVKTLMNPGVRTVVSEVEGLCLSEQMSLELFLSRRSPSPEGS